MKRGGLLVSGVGIALAALLLTGCTAATPAPNDSASPSVPPASSSPSSTPTPTATAVADPQVRVPVSCGTVLTTPDASKLVDAPVTVLTDETTGPTNGQSIARLRHGILTCEWGGKTVSTAGYDQAVSLYVEPDGAKDFAANLAYLKTGLTPDYVNTFGDKSVYDCFAGGAYYCSANVLVGDYWLTATLRNSNKASKVTLATVKTRIQTLVKAVVPALRDAGAAGPAWAAPSGSGNDFCTTKSSTAAVRRAFAAPGLLQDGEPADGGYDVSTITALATPTCVWRLSSAPQKGHVSSVTVDVLAGDGWAIPRLVAKPWTSPYYGRFAAVTIPGTTGAVLACSPKYCNSIVGVGVNAFAVNFDNLGSARNVSSLTTLAASLAKL